MDGWKAGEYFKLKRAPLVLALALLCAPFSASAQAVPAGSSGSDQGFEQRMSVLWQRYQQARLTGDRDAQDAIFSRFQEAGTATSAEIFELGGYLFLTEGYQDLERGDYENARREFLNAAKLNPHLWPAYEGLGLIKRQTGEGFTRFLRLSFKGMQEAFDTHNTWFVFEVLHWLLSGFHRTLMMIMILFSLILCGKYFRQFFASTLNAFEEKHINELYAHLLAIGVTCLPFLLGLNPYLIAALYLVLFFPYFDARERVATLIVFALPLLLPVLAFFSNNITQARIDQQLRAQLTQFLHGDVGAHRAFLENNPGRDQEAHLNALIIGLLEKSEGRLRQALETFDRIPTSASWVGHAQINKGNIRFLAKEYQDALETYQNIDGTKAINALSLYNQGVVKNKQGLHDEAEQLRAQAYRLDRELEARALREGAGRVLDALPNNRARFWRIVAGGGSAEEIGKRLVPSLSLVIFLVVAGLMHTRMRNIRLLAKNCDKCGRIFFPSDSPESEWCSQCVTLYIKKDDLPSEAKLRKHDEVTRYNKRKRLLYGLSQVFFPGSKKLLTGNAISGLLTLVLWAVLVFFSLSPITAVEHASVHYLHGPVLVNWVWFGTTAVFWLIFGLRPIFRED